MVTNNIISVLIHMFQENYQHLNISHNKADTNYQYISHVISFYLNSNFTLTLTDSMFTILA